MARFINIAQDDRNPVCVDADDITAVYESTDEKHGMTVRLSGKNGGRAHGHFDAKHWGVDGDSIVKGLGAAGVGLVSLPLKWPDHADDLNDHGRYLVNPAAFEYIITSKPVLYKGDTEESCAILLSVAGHGMIESYGVPVKTVDAFMAKVAQARPDIRHITEDKATARFYEVGRIAYDPAAIITIYPNGSQVNVRFATGNVIDFNLPRRDWGNLFLNKKFNHVTDPAKRAAFEAKWLTGASHDALFSHISRFERAFEKRLRRAFAESVAADVPGLIKVKNEDGALYHRFNNLTQLSVYARERDGESIEAEIFFGFPEKSPEGSRFGGGDRAYFKTMEKAQAELARLCKIMAARP